MEAQRGTPRVLIFSLRNIFGKALFRCPHFEFEDLICEIDSAELLAPKLDPSSARSSFATRLAYHAPIILNPGLRKISAKQQYDILFTVCGYPQDLIMFNAVSNLRDVCKTSVCLLDELWINEIVQSRHFLPILAKFDVVLLYYSQTVKPLSEIIGRECIYLPPGVDAVSFCPDPNPPERVIDVYSIGRRSEITHRKLLKMARESGLFYLHDSIGGSKAISSGEHRALFANVAKRSRYFIVNPGKIDEPHLTGGQMEAGNRYFEGAASGAIMVGERPRNEVFEDLFDWPDAVTHLSYDSNDIDDVIRDLDADPERQDRIRRTGVVQALMRHDWVYRWEAILKTVGLEPMQGALERKDRLRKLVKVVSQHQRFTESQT
ncbi:MAG TPA: glycosyltransferase [Pyrinomonadaceae bacterium]|nr:glycosyltransferase [Pyrinomonadaceae bacterium]